MRLRLTSAVLLAVLIGAVGCGKKKASSGGDASADPVPVVTPSFAKQSGAKADGKSGLLPGPAEPGVGEGAVDPLVKSQPPPIATPPMAQPPVAIKPLEPPPPPVPMPMAGQLPVIPPVTQPMPPLGATGPKEGPKEPPKAPEWPKEVGGRDIFAYVKECSDPDAAIRETALRTLPVFGPPGRKMQDKDGKNLVGKALLVRMDPDKERDPGVRAAAYAVVTTMGFEDDGDTREAVRILGMAASNGQPGGMARQYAVQALSAFGPKAESAVPHLLLGPSVDPAYETRRSVANTLGRIGLSETKGPTRAALTCLAGQLANDTSAMVRAEAVQSILLLGPPWEGPPSTEKGEKTPKTDEKAAAALIASLKKRLAPAPPRPGEKTAGLVERDKAVEVGLRLAIIRLDPNKELNEDSLTSLAKHVASTDSTARVASLTALGHLGAAGARRITDVTGALDAADPQVVAAAINALGMMAASAKIAVPELQRIAASHKDAEIKKLANEAIKFINDSKPSPAPEPAAKKP